MIDKKYDLKGDEFIKPISSTYSIPIYENGVKTEWTVDGIVGDEKYFKLLEVGGGKNLPAMINVNTKNYEWAKNRRILERKILDWMSLENFSSENVESVAKSVGFWGL